MFITLFNSHLFNTCCTHASEDLEFSPALIFPFFLKKNSMLTTMYKDCYLQTNVMLKTREECGKIKEPGLVLSTSYLFDVLKKQCS